MAPPPTFRFGRPHADTIGRWLQLPPADDGPIWVLNLMQYRAVADYADGRPSSVTGKEADDAYAPVGPLMAVGATVAFFADVTDQRAGEPAWDRIGIVRYPSRGSFFAMQQRDDFQKQYVHKEAGMQFTIVMGCLPATVTSPATVISPATDGDGPAPAGSLVLRLRRFAPDRTPDPDPPGVVPVIGFDVDGVVLGDQRRWDEARFDRVQDGALGLLGELDGIAEQIVVVTEPLIDELVISVVSPPVVD
ncbi:MAG TPA: hypothetical protein VNC61_12010 [Acidimicrobiales bacterium]|nr:hypothetical protein [Acidimicrobiales bacterium]